MNDRQAEALARYREKEASAQTWYRVSKHTGEITPIKVSRVSAQNIYNLTGVRFAIETIDSKHVPVLGEAVCYSKNLLLRQKSVHENCAKAIAAELDELRAKYPLEFERELQP